MFPVSRRRIVVGTTALLLSKLAEAATSTGGSGEVVARAAYRGRDSHWQIALTDCLLYTSDAADE